MLFLKYGGVISAESRMDSEFPGGLDSANLRQAVAVGPTGTDLLQQKPPKPAWILALRGIVGVVPEERHNVEPEGWKGTVNRRKPAWILRFHEVYNSYVTFVPVGFGTSRYNKNDDPRKPAWILGFGGVCGLEPRGTNDPAGPP